MNMPMITQFQENQKTMSTRVIADLTEKRHDHVKRDVENMLGQLGLDIPKFGGIYFDAQNRQQTEYLLDEELTMTLVTGYNIVLRNRVIKRWKELESRELSKMEILQMALESEQQKLVLQAQIALNQPKVDYYEKIVVRDTLLNATQVAQKIGLSAMAMNKYLDQLNVYNRGVKRARIFQQWFVDQGLGELKQTELGFSQPMFTTKGEAWVIEKLVSEGVAA